MSTYLAVVFVIIVVNVIFVIAKQVYWLQYIDHSSKINNYLCRRQSRE